MDFQSLAKAVIRTEADAIEALMAQIDDNFSRACQILLDCRGRIVVLGMGKSGHIGGKIAATLASTGSPAFFVHPAEAGHGDLGMITREDVVIALSNSGETHEVTSLLPVIKRLGVKLVSLTGKPESTLAKASDVHLHIKVDKEACPLNLAPTASTTATLVMGDALAIALLDARGFTADDFALSHPGGSLGRKLLLHVRDLMHDGDKLPRVASGTAIRDAVLEMTAKRLGMTTIVAPDGRLAGIFTDGDLRRSLDAGVNFQKDPVDKVMTARCTTVGPEMLAAEAVNLMETRAINALVVVDENDAPIGALNMHDLLRAGVV